MTNIQDIFKQQEDFAAKNKVPIMENVEVLQQKIAATMPDNILEIGTAIGYSGLKMLSCCSARLTTVEIDEDRQALAKNFIAGAGYLDRVTFLLGDACEIVRFLDDKYDFIFLDGPKGHYAETLPYLKKLLTENGVLFADDIAFKGKAQGDDYPAHKHRTIVNSLRAFIKDLKEDNDFDCEIIDRGDGMLVATKKENKNGR